MNLKLKATIRWSLAIECVGMGVILLACAMSNDVPVTAIATATATATTVPTEQPVLRLEDGAVKVQGENDHWIPVTGESTFELIGDLESTDPWMVARNTFAVRDSTQIAEGLKALDLVQVKGIILQDGTWLANSIEPAEEQIDPALILIGRVNSVDPWMVTGISLNLTTETTIIGEITPDMIVRVEILLLKDGAWDVLSIASLSHFTEIPGCATVTAKVVSVDENNVQFADWPALTLDQEIRIENEAEQEATLEANQSVLVVVCPSENAQFKITKIIILKIGEIGNVTNDKKVLICHKPDKKGGGHTLSVSDSAVPAHLAHGDKPGPCP